MLRILLINPPYFFNTSAAKATYLAMDKKPPLGLLYIASYLKQHSDFEIKILDCELEKMAEEKIRDNVKNFSPDIVGISAVSFKIYPVVKILKIVRAVSPETHICVGGPHLKIYPRETLNYPEADSIIIGDGEMPFLKLCQNLSSSAPIINIHGCYTRQNMPVDGVFAKFEIADLNELPPLDLSLIDGNKYRSFLTNEKLMTAITSRGCPYNCIFCQLDQRVRLISIDKTLNEIENYLNLGVKEIEFYDETFNLNTGRVIEFCDEIIKRKLKFQWSFRGRVNAVSDEMLSKLKQAGCGRIQYGVEAGQDKILRALNKGITVTMAKNCFDLTRKHGIETVAYFMLGNPGETKKDALDTINFAADIKADYANFAIFLLVPGVRAYQMALDEGVLARDYWLEYIKNPLESLPMLYWNKEISQEELVKLKSLAVKKFYFRFNYILERFKRLSWKNLLSYLRGFLYIIYE